MLKTAIIISTTRDTRFADKPVHWLREQLKKHPEISPEVVDLRDFPMPFFNEVASNAYAPSKDPAAQKWQKKVAEFDAYIFVTAEYNRTIPAALKNAIDYAYPEWIKKPATFLGYGSVGAARAIEHLRTVCVELQMAPLRSAVHIQGGDFFAVWQQGKSMAELKHLEAGAKTMLDELTWWGHALKQARQADNT